MTQVFLSPSQSEAPARREAPPIKQIATAPNLAALNSPSRLGIDAKGGCVPLYETAKAGDTAGDQTN